MIGALVAGLLAGYGIAVPVGAVGTYLVTLTARTSLKIGAFAALGIASADMVFAATAMLGGSALARSIQPAMQPLRWVSGFVLIGLALRGLAAAVRRYRSRASGGGPESGGTPATALRAYLSFWGITLLNPLTIIYFAALVFGGQARATPNRPDQAVFVLATFAASASWQLLLAGGGALLGRVLTSDRGRLGTALASSTLILALAVHLLLPAK